MKAKLIGQGRPGGTRVYDLPQGEALLGTERGATVQVVSSGVSRRHARILWDGHHHYLEDLKGTNGTHLNGQLVYRERLQHLDVISLGRQCNLVYMTPGASASAAESSESPTLLTESTRGPAPAAAVSKEPEPATIVQLPRDVRVPARPKSSPASESGTVAIRAGATPSPPPTPRDTEVDRDFLLRKSYKRPAVKGSTSGVGLNLPLGLEARAEVPAPQSKPAPVAESRPAPDRAVPPKKPQPAAAVKRDAPERVNGAPALPESPAPLRYVALVPEGEQGVPHVVTVGTITLGRSVFCDIVPDSEAVSRFHARVEYTGDQVVLHDGGSLNGTFVNGKRVKTAVLKDGDTLSLAGVHAYKVVVRSSEPVSAARRPPVSTPSPEPVRAMLATPIPKASSERLGAPASDPKRAEPKVREVKPAPAKSLPDAGAGSVAKWRSRLTGKWKTILEGKWLSKRDVLDGDWLRAPEKGPLSERQPSPRLRPGLAEAQRVEAESASEASVGAGSNESDGWSPQPNASGVGPRRSRRSPDIGRDAAPNGVQKKDSLRISEPMRVVDVVLSGLDVKGHFSEPGAYLLGRTRAADLRVESTSVSRRHARLVISDDRTAVAIEDMESANGTSVNGVRVGRHRLADGDVVTLGGFSLKVRIKKR